MNLAEATRMTKRYEDAQHRRRIRELARLAAADFHMAVHEFGVSRDRDSQLTFLASSWLWIVRTEPWLDRDDLRRRFEDTAIREIK